MCCEGVSTCLSGLVEEVEKLQDLSFTALRRKLFEAPLEMQEEHETVAVAAMSSEDEFDGLLVTNSGLEVRDCVKVRNDDVEQLQQNIHQIDIQVQFISICNDITNRVILCLICHTWFAYMYLL